MNMKIFDKMPHIDRLCGKLRRGVAVTLALSMVLPMTTAFGVDLEETCPVRSDKYPDIAIEGNFVRNEFGFLVKDEEGNGVFELGLQVKTPAGESFRALNVSLEYDTGFLAPIDWESDFQEINLDGFDYYKRQLPTQKLDEISTAAAHGGKPASTGGSTGGGSTGDSGIAGGGTATAAEGDGTTGGDATGGATDPALSDAVANGEKALLTFTARSYKPVEFPEDPLQPDKLTTIAVIRFKVDKEQMEHISIKKRADGEYDLLYNVSGEKGKEKKITNVAELQAETATTVGDPTTGIRIMGFATDDDIFVTKENSTVKMALRYQSWTSEYYYVPEYDPADLTTYVTDSGVMIGEKKYQLDKPKTNNDMVLAVDPAAADDGVDSASTPTANSLKYSYITNLIVNKPESTAGAGDGHDYITLPLVSKRSFMDNKDTLGNLTTIVYVDWDNALLGTQIVPKNTDVRGLVSEYVAENFIYHDDDDTTYGPLDLNNPLALVLPTDTDDSKALDAVKSLARKDNYRGKYPYDGPQPDGTTTNTVTDGEKYALSNKLDYVFLKRPMTYAVPKPDPKDKVDDGTGTMIDKYPGGATDPQYIADLKAWEANDSNKWVQKSETTTTSGGTTGSTSTGTPGVVASYDIENPFAYGWAKCTVDSFENTWTTLGMGELDSYNGASLGGYNDMNGALAEVTVSDTDTPLVFADLEKGFTKEEDTVFLKAVYEPGEDLLNTDYTYRLISDPYYNKLNKVSASEGGAYSVDVTFERASVAEGPVRGIARMREPYVRQDTTTDLLWEADHDLPNADTMDAYSTKTKSSFVKVTVSNAEEVDVSLTLSGRHNKVDYYLKEGYGSNFADGSERSDNDGDRAQGYADGQATLDNYNYFVKDESDETDVWYDCTYGSRNGSRGFVLEGTLNQVMQLATQVKQGELASAEFDQYITETVLRDDLNLALHDGTYATMANAASMATMSAAILDAAQVAIDAHDGGNNAYWDSVHECAKLTYHQLQGFIIDRAGGSTGGSLNHGEGTITGLTWCHLHKGCADLSSDKPSTWEELIQKARSSDPSDISKLTTSEMESLAHLRADGNGTAFGTVAAFQNAVVAAVQALDGGVAGVTTIYTWDQVQTQILGDPTADSYKHAKENYWWYDGTTSVTFANLGDTLAAAQEAMSTNTKKAPGETAATARPAKLRQLKDALDDAVAGTSKTAWVTATEYLCAGEDQLFADIDAFQTALTDALTRASAASVSSPDWWQLQYAILHPADPFPSLPYTDPGHEAEMDGYYWHNGGSKVTDLATLLNAADQANKGNSASLNALTVTDLYDSNNPQLHFRGGFDGTKYTTGDLDNFKNAVKTLVDAEGTNLTWDQVQYYLIYGSISGIDPMTISKESTNYYWWKNNGGGSSVSFGGTYDAVLNKILEAAYRSGVNGNPKAWDELTAAVVRSARLVQSDDNSTTFADLPAVTDLGAFKTTLEGLVAAAGGLAGGPGQSPVLPSLTNLSWEKVQYAVIHGSLPDDPPSTAQQTEMDGYWWKTKDAQSMSASAYLGQMQTALQDFIDNGGSDTTAIETWATAENLNGAGFVTSSGTAFTNDDAQALIDNGAWWGFDIYTFYDASTVSWYELQYFLINGCHSYMGDQDILDDISNNWGITITPPSDIPAPTSAFALRAAPMMMTLRAEADPEAMTEEEKAAYTAELIQELERVTGKKVDLVDPDQPAPVETEVPVPVETEEPAPVETGDPAPVETEDPIPVETGDPAPVETEDPIPVETGDPAPVETEDPIPVETEDPAPVETEDPIPVETGDPAPVETEDPIPVETEDPAPAETGAPNDPGGSSGEIDNTDAGSGVPDAPQEEGDNVEEENITNFETGVIALTELLSADSTEAGGTENGGPPNETAEVISASASDSGRTASDTGQRCTEPLEPDPLLSHESIGRITL